MHIEILDSLKYVGKEVWNAFKFLLCLFVCLEFFVPHTYGDVTITAEGLQISTYARHLWPLSSEGSLACHTYCDMGHPFKMVISEDP